MTEREAIKIALEKCEWGFMEDAANILRQSLAQSEQKTEPTAWVTDDFAITYTAEVAQHWRDKGWKVVPFYTEPLRKEWIGLTDEERNRYRSYTAENFGAGVLWAETKLWERNK